jgi:hypothetical protein
VKLVRSWPAEIPDGRSYVMDDIPKFVMTQFDYRGLAELDDDVVLIEWDIAVGGEQLATFMDRAKAEPNRVRVAPYLLYRGGRGDGQRQVPFYCHRIREPGTRSWVKGPQDKVCHMFGFGLIYLPRQIIVDYLEHPRTQGEPFGDTQFSRWHMRYAKHREVPIDWDCHAVHLHYKTPEVP